MRWIATLIFLCAIAWKFAIDAPQTAVPLILLPLGLLCFIFWKSK